MMTLFWRESLEVGRINRSIRRLRKKHWIGMISCRFIELINVKCYCRGRIPNRPNKPARKVQTPRSRLIILTSSSEDSDDDSHPKAQESEVIEITDSSPERSPKKPTREKTTTTTLPRPRLKEPSSSAPERMLPLYADDDTDNDEPCNVDDGSILTL